MNITVTQVKGLIPNMNAKNKDGTPKVYKPGYRGIMYLDLEIADGDQTMTVTDVPFWVSPDKADPAQVYARYKYPDNGKESGRAREYAPVVKFTGLRDTATRILQNYWPAIVACQALVVKAPGSEVIRLLRVNEPVTANTSGPVGNN